MKRPVLHLSAVFAVILSLGLAIPASGQEITAEELKVIAADIAAQLEADLQANLDAYEEAAALLALKRS